MSTLAEEIKKPETLNGVERPTANALEHEAIYIIREVAAQFEKPVLLFSGGKDSIYVAHILKNKYGMNPLTVTWAPHLRTDIGQKNLDSMIDSGLDNIIFWTYSWGLELIN